MLQALGRSCPGKIDRLAICLPPGAGKSVYTQFFAAWWLANNPSSSIILASHTQSLADSQSIVVRNLVEEHGTALGIALDPRTTAAERWALQSGAEVRAVGGGAAVVGFRGTLVLADDLLKGIEQAMSAGEKQKLYDWYRETSDETRSFRSLSRFKQNGHWTICSGACSTKRATAGHCCRCQPTRKRTTPSEEKLMSRSGRTIRSTITHAEQKRSLPPRMFVSLFQQRPVAEEGNLVKGEWLKIYHTPPDPSTCHFYIGFDLATSEGRGDFSAIVTIAVDPSGDCFVVDVWRKQTTIDKTIDALLDRCRDFRPRFVATEAGGLHNAAGPFLRSRMTERRIFAYVVTVPSGTARKRAPSHLSEGLRPRACICRTLVAGSAISSQN